MVVKEVDYRLLWKEDKSLHMYCVVKQNGN